MRVQPHIIRSMLLVHIILKCTHTLGNFVFLYKEARGIFKINNKLFINIISYSIVEAQSYINYVSLISRYCNLRQFTLFDFTGQRYPAVEDQWNNRRNKEHSQSCWTHSSRAVSGFFKVGNSLLHTFHVCPLQDQIIYTKLILHTYTNNIYWHE